MKPKQNIVLSAFGAAVGIKLVPLLESHVEPDWLAIVFGSLGGALCFGLAHLLIRLPFLFPALRRYYAQVYGIEGYWFELVENEEDHPYSLGWIRFKPSSGFFKYRGRNFRRDLSIHARWSSKAIVPDEEAEKISFLYDAELVKGTETIHGHGSLEFSNYLGNKYNSGNGSFVESGMDLKRNSLVLERISGKTIKTVTGKAKPENEDDMKTLILHILETKGLPVDTKECEQGADDQLPARTESKVS